MGLEHRIQNANLERKISRAFGAGGLRDLLNGGIDSWHRSEKDLRRMPIQGRKATLEKLLKRTRDGIAFKKQLPEE